MNIETIVSVLRWVEDITEGEMIECPRDGYTRKSFLIEGLSFDEQETICELVNPMLIALNLNVILDFDGDKLINRLSKNK